jgi:septum formation inhibitor MinC
MLEGFTARFVKAGFINPRLKRLSFLLTHRLKTQKKGKENAARKNHRKRPMAMPPKEKGGIYIYSCINSGVSFRQNNHLVLFGSFNPYFFLALKFRI